MAMSNELRSNSGENEHGHNVQEDIFHNPYPSHTEMIATMMTPAHKGTGTPAKDEGTFETVTEMMTRKRKQKQADKNHNHIKESTLSVIGSLQPHGAAMIDMITVGEEGNSGPQLYCGSPSRRPKMEHSDPVRWKIKTPIPQEQHHGLREAEEVMAIEQQALQPPPIVFDSAQHVADIAQDASGGNFSASRVQLAGLLNTELVNIDAATVAPAPSVDAVVQTVSSRLAAAPALDPVVFEREFLPWNEVYMPDEAYRCNSNIKLYPALMLGN